MRKIRPRSKQVEKEDDDESVSKSDVSLSKQEAKDVATNKVSGTVQSVELESEDGTPVYEVTVKASKGTIKEVVVHANTGEVLEVESDD